jgi:uncharacterized cofD-like protein
VSAPVHGRRPVVAIGGGHGCSRSLAALRRLGVGATAVVTVADDGGSSGRLRRDHDVVALGDLRMALLALADGGADGGEEGDADSGGRSIVAALARRRFARGELAGHSLGNLLLLGLIEEHEGDLLGALEAFSALLGTDGLVLPVTVDPVTLVADTATGTVEGQAAVATTRRIRRVRLEPGRPRLTPGVVDAIAGADVVLLGPGSLYTSILPVLLVPGMEEALVATSALVVLVGNMREQPGETEGMDLADQVEALREHVPRLRIDVVLAHEPDPGRPVPSARVPLPISEVRLAGSAGAIVRRDLGDELDGHDPARLAAAVAELLVRRGDASGPVGG